MQEPETPRGPWVMAREIEALIPETLAKREAATDKRERKRLSSQLRAQRFLLNWCKSRVGYVEPTNGSAAKVDP